MATEVLMPKLGNTVESCLLLEWRKQEGEAIQRGDVLCEVETDKASFEVEAEQDGTLLKLLFEGGDDIPVLTPIAFIGEPGDDLSGMLPEDSPKAEAADETQTAPAPQDSAPQVATAPVTVSPPSVSGTGGISPRARHLAAAKGLNIAGLTGTGPEGRIIERDVLAAFTEHAPLTPAAIAALVEQGMQAPATGSGIGGRVTTADLTQDAATIEATPHIHEFPGTFKDLPVKGVRKIIAGRMLESLQTTAQVTLSASADASQLLAYRTRLKASPEDMGLSGITINDLVLYAVAHTLPHFPFLNAHFLGESIREFASIHLGVAVDMSKGLMVPVIRHAGALSLKALAVESKRLISACQDGTILPDELTGATFTVTNLGALGIESFTPVLNPPEVGILGVCAIQPKPVMHGDEVTYSPHIGLSFTFDHRAVDGAPAARFLNTLSTAIAHFDLLLAG